MSDQATELRRLAMRAHWPQPEGAGPSVLVVAGGHPGVGATTLAVELAKAWAADALRVVLLDADLHQADVAARCGLPAAGGIGDVLLARRNIHEALQRGPGSIQVLTGNGSAEARLALSDQVRQRLLMQINLLGPHVDWVIADSGSRPSGIGSWLWSMAERVLLVTTPENAAVMSTYAQIKSHMRRQPMTAPLDLVVTRSTEDMARDVHRRIDQSCRRFLGLSVGLAATVPAVEPRGQLLAAAIEQLSRAILEAHPLPQQSAA